jgi:heptosyltransferase-3
MEKNKTALFIKTKNIGDSIILTAAIAALPDEYQYVDIVCLPESKEIFEMCPRVRNIFIIPRHLIGIKKWLFYFNETRIIMSHKYDFFAHFSTDWRGAILSRFLKPKMSVAIRNNRRNRIWIRSFNLIANISNENRSAVEQDVDLLRRAEIYNQPEAPPYSIIPSEVSEYSIKMWSQLNINNDRKKKIILIHTSSRWKFKQLTIYQWKSIIDSLLQKNNISIIMSGSVSDFMHIKLISDLCKIKPLIKITPTLQEAASLIKFADLVVSIDSMAIHLASALKKPLIAIYGPTDDRKWSPWKTKYKILALNEVDSPSFACRPCRLDGCGGSKISQCLTQMSSDYVVKNILNFLEAT